MKCVLCRIPLKAGAEVLPVLVAGPAPDTAGENVGLIFRPHKKKFVHVHHLKGVTT